MTDDTATEKVEQMAYTQYYFKSNSLWNSISDASYEVESFFAITEIAEEGGTNHFFCSEE